MFNLKNAKDQIFDLIHRKGEEVKNNLPNWISRVVESDAWEQETDANGKRFGSFGEWLVASYPFGPGVGSGEFAITYEQLIALCEDNRKDLANLLKDNRPKRKRGGDHGNQHTGGKCDNVTDGKNRVHGSNSRLYIEERLKRDFPEIWKSYLNGGYSSARQAGIAAGFVKDTHDALMRLKCNWNKATKAQRRAFMKWLKESDTK